MILLFFYFIFSIGFNNIIIIIVTKLSMAIDTSLDSIFKKISKELIKNMFGNAVQTVFPKNLNIVFTKI
jgi:hypothetical protein